VPAVVLHGGFVVLHGERLRQRDAGKVWLAWQEHQKDIKNKLH
jgi:hypothetical protein